MPIRVNSNLTVVVLKEYAKKNWDYIGSKEKIMSIIETSNKIYKPSTYKKVIFNPIYSR